MFRPWESNYIKSTTSTDFSGKILEMPLKPKSKENKHLEPVNLNAVLNYLSGQGYPIHVQTKNEKSNFRKQTKPFYVDNGTLIYKKNALRVIIDHAERRSILKMVHERSDASEKGVASSGHRGRDATIRLLNRRCYWPNITKDTKTFIKECSVCQRVSPTTLKTLPELRPMPKMVRHPVTSKSWFFF